MLRNGLRIVMLAAVLGGALAGETQAATLDLKSVTGAWTGLTPTPGTTGVNGLGTNTVKWGATSRKKPQSGYSFLGKTAAGITGGEVFDLGTFTHSNREIGSGSSIAGASLKVAIKLVIEGVEKTFDAAFNFAHLETANTPKQRSASCANGGANKKGVNRNGCADKVTVDNSNSSTNTFELNGFLYTLEILGFTANGTEFSEFWTTEKLENSATPTGRSGMCTAARSAGSAWCRWVACTT